MNLSGRGIIQAHIVFFVLEVIKIFLFFKAFLTEVTMVFQNTIYKVDAGFAPLMFV